MFVIRVQARFISSFILLLSSVFACAKRERLSNASWAIPFPPFIQLTRFKMTSVTRARAVMPLTIDVCTFWNFKSWDRMVELMLSQISWLTRSFVKPSQFSSCGYLLILSCSCSSYMPSRTRRVTILASSS